MPSLYVTRSHKMGLKSLGPMRARGEEVKDNHCVFHLIPTLQLTVTFVPFKKQDVIVMPSKTAF